jgi:hypothetical protein
VKAEREVAMLKDQAQCYEENTSKLKGKLLSFIKFAIEHISQLMNQQDGKVSMVRDFSYL